MRTTRPRRGARTFCAKSSGCNNSTLQNQSHAQSRCTANCYFRSKPVKPPFLAVWASAGAELGTDILRYTDVAPIIQFNEIKISVPALPRSR